MLLGKLGNQLSKLAFCLRVSRNAATVLSLLSATRRFAAAIPNGVALSPELLSEATDYKFVFSNLSAKVRLRTFTGDVAILYEMFWRRTYDLPQMRELYFETIVDVGANVGLAALFFQSKWPDAQLICLEPDPANFALLQHNLKATSATVLPVALDNQDRTLQISPATYAYNVRVSEGAGINSIAAISMSSLLQSQQLTRIDFLKIDIEDYEQVVFSQGTDWLLAVANLLIEIHSTASYEAVRKALTERGFSMKKASDQADAGGLYWAQNPALT